MSAFAALARQRGLVTTSQSSADRGPGGVTPGPHRGRRPDQGRESPDRRSRCAGPVGLQFVVLRARAPRYHGVVQRREPRIPTHRRILIRFKAKQEFETLYLRDISKGGLFVRTTAARQRGEEVTVVLDLPERGEVTLTGRVAHVVPAGPGVEPGRLGVGIALDPVSPVQQALIDRYLGRCVAEYIDSPDEGDEVLPLPVPPLGPILDLMEPPGADAGAASADPVPPPMPVQPADPALLEEALTAIEGRLAAPPADAYRALAAQPHDARATIEEAYRRDRASVDPRRAPPPVLPALRERLERAVAALDAAWSVLSQPAARAHLDLQRAVVPPPPARTDAERRALYAEAEKLYPRYAESNRDSVQAAHPMLQTAQKDLREGRPKFARNALRIALTFSPLDTRIWRLLEELAGDRPAERP